MNGNVCWMRHPVVKVSSCPVCGHIVSFTTSQQIGYFMDFNCRSVLAVREIGCGRACPETFCCNMPHVAAVSVRSHVIMEQCTVCLYCRYWLSGSITAFTRQFLLNVFALTQSHWLQHQDTLSTSILAALLLFVNMQPGLSYTDAYVVVPGRKLHNWKYATNIMITLALMCIVYYSVPYFDYIIKADSS